MDESPKKGRRSRAIPLNDDDIKAIAVDGRPSTCSARRSGRALQQFSMSALKDEER
jgi:hypothetical protein